MFEDPFGSVRRAFTVQIAGRWEQETFVLDEHFQFSDGATDRRVWRLRYRPDGHFAAECGDTVSAAAGHMVQNGCAMSYHFRLAIGSRLVTVKFQDLFHLVDEYTLLNRAKVTKWGLPIGRVTAAFRRLPDGTPAIGSPGS